MNSDLWVRLPIITPSLLFHRVKVRRPLADGRSASLISMGWESLDDSATDGGAGAGRG